MIVRRVATTGVPDLRSAQRVARLAWPVLGVQGRRVAGVTTRGRCSPPYKPTPTTRLGRPRSTRRTDTATTQSATQTSTGHTRHHPAMAPPPGDQEMDLPEPDRTPSDREHHRRVDRTDGAREHRLGIPQDSRRTAQTRPPRVRVDHPARAQTLADPASTTPRLGHFVAAVPAYPGDDIVGLRFLPRRLRGHAQTRLLGGLINEYAPAAA